MGKKAVVTRTETTTDDADGATSERDRNLDVALFADAGDTEDERIARIQVSREDPEEGILGDLDADSTELEVFNKWGGSKYHLTAKNARGRIVTKRTIRIAGEPIFMSEVAEMRWRRANGLKPKKAETDIDPGAYSAKELIAIMEAKAEAARVDSESREEKRRREDADREEKLRRDEREWRERVEREKSERDARVRAEERESRERIEIARREDDKRREDLRREEDRQREARMREDEQRREKEHERQMAQAAALAKESQEKSQQFFTNMLAMTKAGDKAASDPMAQVTQILTIVEALKSAGGGGEQDAVSALLSRLPETLQAAGNMVGGAIREAKGLPAQGQGGGQGGDEEELEPGAIKLTGEAAKKVKELVTHLISKGQDPEKVLVQAADYLMGKKPGAAVQAARVAEGKARAELEARRAAKGGKRPARRKAKPRATQASKPVTPPATSPAARPAPLAKPPGAP